MTTSQPTMQPAARRVPRPLGALLAIAAALVIGSIGRSSAQSSAAPAQASPPQPPVVAAAPGQFGEYKVGVGDVVSVTVWNQLDMSGKFTVEPDGTFVFPLLGRIAADGQTGPQIAATLKTLLMKGFFKAPEVTVAVEEYNSQRVFVVGEVREPGAIPLRGKLTLVEALALAGSAGAEAATEIVVVRRAPQAPVVGPNFPGSAAGGEVVRIDFARLHSGDASQNLELFNGDTVFVPRPQTAFVSGQVRNPGVYPIGPSTTALQALTLAGGVTDRGAPQRLRVIRIVDGAKRQLRMKLTDLVRAGDTLVVPERFF